MDGVPEETEAAVGYTLCEHYPLPRPACHLGLMLTPNQHSPLTSSCSGIVEGDLEAIQKPGVQTAPI